MRRFRESFVPVDRTPSNVTMLVGKIVEMPGFFWEN
jgi:hypothetical protein